MKPILFSAPMVRAILDGRKTMTRRLPDARIRRKWNKYDAWAKSVKTGEAPPLRMRDTHNESEFYKQRPPYFAGDVLWVRETWASALLNGGLEGFIDTFAYKADGSVRYSSRKAEDLPSNAISAWQPSIFMPQEAARLFLRVTDVRVERLWDIIGNLDDLEREGINIAAGMFGASMTFSELWDSFRKPKELQAYGWDANPWVWVVSFERCAKPE